MTDAHPSRTLHRIVAVVVVALAGSISSTALADDSSPSARKGALPGVTSDYRIAKPAPQPEPDDAFPSNGNGQYKIGNTDVRISGSITVDVGAGATGLPRH
ncbi:hypothetical protein [Mesorhizobium sangaii]|uniref:Uncharacterized protein n=1 Tax=Mesorhizobium sangaii TaxID=505389 RepID=A0A841PK18_9HYPH|nr:hypothetical protein [Mesorhizobium sangaii]MBB6411060.1 hypothetical protein [Mesorhizobium sangaii]